MSPHLTILIITDSLAFPRSEPTHVPYDQTWVALLKQACPNADILHHGRGGATLRDLWGHAQYYVGTLDPDLVVVQSGIVDCAPRALTRIEKMIIDRVPGFLGRFVQRNAVKLRRLRTIQYGPEDQFKAHIKLFEDAFKRMIWLGITPPNSDWETTVPGITDAIAKHDALLAAQDHILLSDLTADDMMSDHHHLNQNGHEKVANKLLAHAFFVSEHEVNTA